MKYSALPLRPPRAKVVLPYRHKISSPESLALSFWERHRHRNASFEFPKKFTPAGKYPRRYGVIRSSGNIRQSGDCAASVSSPIRAPFSSAPSRSGNPSYPRDLISMIILWSILTYPIAYLMTRPGIDPREKRAGPSLRESSLPI